MNITIKNKKAEISIHDDYVSMSFIDNPKGRVYYDSLDCYWDLKKQKASASHKTTEHEGLDYFEKHLYGKSWENIEDAIIAAKTLINYVVNYCAYGPIINEIDDIEFKKLVSEVYKERAKKEEWE